MSNIFEEEIQPILENIDCIKIKESSICCYELIDINGGKFCEVDELRGTFHFLTKYHVSAYNDIYRVLERHSLKDMDIFTVKRENDYCCCNRVIDKTPSLKRKMFEFLPCDSPLLFIGKLEADEEQYEDTEYDCLYLNDDDKLFIAVPEMDIGGVTWDYITVNNYIEEYNYNCYAGMLDLLYIETYIPEELMLPKEFNKPLFGIHKDSCVKWEKTMKNGRSQWIYNKLEI